MKSDLLSTDLYETRHLSPITDLDYKVLTDLYMPLVGTEAIGAYLSLLSCTDSLIESHEKIFKRTLLSLGQWINSLKALEAVGLVETRLAENEKIRLFSYLLYAPKSPNIYFADPLYARTLEGVLGKEETEALAKLYSNPPHPEEGEDVSETFESYFSSSISSPRNSSPLVSGGKVSRSPNTLFSLSSFFSFLKGHDKSLNESTYSNKELLYISHLSSLYGYSEETMADFSFENSLFSNSFGYRLNKKRLEKECLDSLQFSYLKESPSSKTKIPGDSSFSNMVRGMEKMSPIAFLTSLQKGHKIASSDASLLEELTGPMGLSASATNALIFFTLATKNNTLPKAFVEKVGASLIREGALTAVDALNYLNKTTAYSRSLPKKDEPVLPSIDKEPNEIRNEEATPSKETEKPVSYDEMMAALVFHPKK